jgi:sec-independent protein translocase protein TatC
MDERYRSRRKHEKPFLDHLEDLRWTILKMLASLLVGILVTAAFVPRVFDILERPLTLLEEEMRDTGYPIELVARKPSEGITNIMKVSLFAGLVVASPAMLFFLMQFVLPALTRREMKVIIPGLVIGTALFFLGLVFCYYVTLPMVTRVMWLINSKLGLANLWTLSDYLSFMTGFMLANGLIFELPLALFVLVRLGVLSISTLKRGRRHAVIIMLALGAVLSPPDPGSMFLVALPMLILYEASIWLSVLAMRKDSRVSGSA